MKPTNPILVDLIARRLTEIREQHNHTKEYVLHNTGLGISGYENKVRFPSLESIAKFCKFYNISLEKFFAGNLSGGAAGIAASANCRNRYFLGV